jgi:hypothetical protein
MTVKKGWEKSTNGPDWTDVEMIMRAISAVHGGHVALVFSPNGTGATGGLDVAASMIFDVLPGSLLPATVATSSVWPCSTHKTLAAHAFDALHRLDFEIGKAYKSEPLWE